MRARPCNLTNKHKRDLYFVNSELTPTSGGQAAMPTSTPTFLILAIIPRRKARTVNPSAAPVFLSTFQQLRVCSTGTPVNTSHSHCAQQRMADTCQNRRTTWLFHERPVYSGVIASTCLLYTSPSPRDLSTSRMPSSA